MKLKRNIFRYFLVLITVITANISIASDTPNKEDLKDSLPTLPQNIRVKIFAQLSDERLLMLKKSSVRENYKGSRDEVYSLLLQRGLDYLKKRNAAKAKGMFQQMIQIDIPSLTIKLKPFFLNKKEVDTNYENALIWVWEDSLKLGNVQLRYPLAEMYLDFWIMKGKKEKRIKGLDLLMAAFDDGDVNAYFKMGCIFHDGLFEIPQDFIRAFNCFQMAHVSNHPAAIDKLLAYYWYGFAHDGIKNIDQYIKILKTGVLVGRKDCMFELALAYINKKKYNKAKDWLDKIEDENMIKSNICFSDTYVYFSSFPREIAKNVMFKSAYIKVKETKRMLFRLIEENEE